MLFFAAYYSSREMTETKRIVLRLQNFDWLIYSGQICQTGWGNYIIYISFYCKVSSKHKVQCQLVCRWSQAIARSDLINQGEPRARRVWGNKRWLNSARNSDVVKSSRNKDLRYRQKKLWENIKKILLYNQVHGHGWFKEPLFLVFSNEFIAVLIWMAKGY